MTVGIRISNTYVLLTHGASDSVKARVPKGKSREIYFLDMLNSDPEKLVGAKDKLVIMGDLHHFEYVKYNSFDFLLLPSPICGDRYSDHLNLHSRPQQVCLILNENGIKEHLLYSFD